MTHLQDNYEDFLAIVNKPYNEEFESTTQLILDNLDIMQQQFFPYIHL